VNNGAKVETQIMLDMFSNTGGNANGNFSFTSSKQIKDKTAQIGQSVIIEFMSTLSEISGVSDDGTSGKAGIVKSGTKQYFFDANGVEYQQLIEKGIMGACFFNQITNVYLSSDKMNVDNSVNIEDKNYTAMQHHWDEAFGYLGATSNSPIEETGERYWQKYAHKSNKEVTNNIMDTPKNIINAFIKGRYAINKKDYTERDKQIDIIIKKLEIIAATSALHYINASLKTFSDDALRNHQLSEAYAFIWSLKFINFQNRIISESKINQLLENLGLRYYDVTIDQLNLLRDEIASIYNLEEIKTNF
jgi:hypothetical protein